MSEVARTYGGAGRPLRRRRRFTSRRHWGRALLAAVLAIVLVGLWSTRDSQPQVRFIPANQKYLIAVGDVFGHWDRIAESRVWAAVPLEAVLLRPADITGRLPMPQWVLNNLVTRESYLTGNDISTFEDLVCVTTMSRIGCLLERLQGLVPGIDGDPAGGLRLRILSKPGLCYAVRGRTLIVSRSRDALIRSLTLPKDASLTSEELANRVARSGLEDVRGSVVFTPKDASVGRILQGLSFAFRIEPESVQLKWRAALQTEWRKTLDQLLQDVTPQQLTAPLPGCIGVSVNLGKPVRQVWTGMGEAFQWGLLSEEQWRKWARPTASETPGLGFLLVSLLNEAGPGFRLSCHGVDLNEMCPLPEVVGAFEVNPDTLLAAFEALPPPPASVKPWDSYPRYDREAKRVYVPMIGGPSLEPTAGLRGRHLLISTSRTVGETLLREEPNEQSLPWRGNLYIQIRPLPCVQSMVDVGRLLAEMECLRGYTQESFEPAAAEWIKKASVIDEIRLVAGVAEGEVEGELAVVCKPVS